MGSIPIEGSGRIKRAPGLRSLVVEHLTSTCFFLGFLVISTKWCQSILQTF